MPSPKPQSTRILHVLVGHNLPAYYENAVRSVRMFAHRDELLVIDNASTDKRVEPLLAAAAKDPKITVIRRETNELANTKVGGLYHAYADAFSFAIEHGFRFLHVMQADMQMLWWDDEVVSEVAQIFERHEDCVNVQTAALTRDVLYGDHLRRLEDSVFELTRYGITDTGVFHLGRWQAGGLSFGSSEREHARNASRLGYRALAIRVPPVAPIPWPAVTRRGKTKGREVVPVHRLLLRPLSAVEVDELRDTGVAWLEDVCIPWGWSCLTPMSSTAPESFDYWIRRYREARHRGALGAFPRWDRRGLEPGRRLAGVQRRPYLHQLVTGPLVAKVSRSLARP